MNRLTFFVLFLLLGTFFVISANGQSRPRRVGNQTSPVVTPDPSAAPVLRGNNRAPGQQPAPAPAQTQQEPEEVEAGDVIRVNTTLVTIPLSVTDRDGRYIPNLVKEDFRLWEDGI